MEFPRIVDFHVHLCRSVEEEKRVFPRVGWPDEWYWGNEERIISYMDVWNISHIVIVNFMDTRTVTRARLARASNQPGFEHTQAWDQSCREEMVDRVRRFNTWACELYRSQPRIIPFVMADPVLFGVDAVEEVERCLSLGAQGVKMHPRLCAHMPDDPRALPIYELCRDQSVTILTDTSGVPNGEGDVFGAPIYWRPVLKQFSELKLILAHMCGERWDEQLVLAREFGDNVFFDISGGLVDESHPIEAHREMPIQEGKRVFREIGPRRILFGSDLPIRVPDTVSQVLQLGLSDEENRWILRDNAVGLLGL
jgi:predicted TIM-barrel fold metal-dependent hydrolase